ncbi:MAG: acetyl-CoA C-acyltransferase, partial [Anaerolineales bacterium]
MENEHNQAVILSAVRTPTGRFLGTLSSTSATRLGAIVVQEAVSRARIKDLAKIDEVLMGCVVPAGLGQNPARQAAIFGGLPGTVGATTINKVCGSGLKTVMLAAQAIKAGDGNLFVAGGMESMSGTPFLVYGRTGQLRYGHSQLVDTLQHDGLWDPFEHWIMGEASDFIADEYNVTRE